MKPARIIVLVIAVVAGGIAALLAGRSDPPPPAKVAAPPLATVEVLVAGADIAMGHRLTADDLRWQLWPRDAAGPSFIRKSDQPDAREAFIGAIVRSAFVAGEPVREDKVVKAGGSGFMAAILPAGKRAVSTEISPETGAGGFILPNDRVDVILTYRDRDAERRTGSDAHVSEIILSDIRVLAIDQTVQERGGEQVVVGKTATLELTPGQAETLALAVKLGSLSLALRSLADANREPAAAEEAGRRQRNEINMVRFGIATTASPR